MRLQKRTDAASGMVSLGHRTPRIGCGAAIIAAGKLLLVQRRRDPEAGCWGLPGGKVDCYEPLVCAVQREIREEIGVEIMSMTLLCVVDQIDRSNEQHWVAPVYLVDRYVGTPTIMELDAIAGVEWFSLDALPEPLTEATMQAVAALAGNGRWNVDGH